MQQRFLRWLRGGDGTPYPKNSRELDLTVLDPRIYYSASIMPVEFFADAAPIPTAQIDPDLLQMMSDWTAGEASPLLPPSGLNSTTPSENSSNTPGSGSTSAPSPATINSNSEAAADRFSGVGHEPNREGELIDVQLDELDRLLADLAATDETVQLDVPVASLTPTGYLSFESTVSHELIIIQDGIENVDQLIADLTDSPDDRYFDIVVLNAIEDGFSQIDRLLSEYENLDAIHIVSHGTEGTIQLGGSWLTAWNVEQHRHQLQQWGMALNESADILIYGCDTAGSADGRMLIEAIASATQADVAASIDLTGHAKLDGNWILEQTVGVVETQIAFSNSLTASWESALTVATFQEGTSGYAGSADTFIDQSLPTNSFGGNVEVEIDFGADTAT